ncbi:MAG: MarR family transcriptional regulator [Pelagimonas sp.]|nr:MarR family transcriptional regulator [Pelagimonas sp.]
MNIAVLTGDIVGSTDLSADALDDIMHALHGACGIIAGWDSNLQTAFARQSGDGWQLALSDPGLDFRAGLYLQATLRSLDKTHRSRIAYATGNGTPPTHATDLNSATGPAYTASGRLLSQISGSSLMAHADGGARSATIALADHISQGWTQTQAQALCETLPPTAGPRAEVAKRLGITREAVNQRLWSAGFPALERALEAWETVGTHPRGAQT